MAAEILTRPPVDFAGKAIELAGPEALTHYDISAILSSVLGKKLQFSECDTATFVKSLEVLNAFPAEVAAVRSLLLSVVSWSGAYGLL